VDVASLRNVATLESSATIVTTRLKKGHRRYKNGIWNTKFRKVINVGIIIKLM
jgi:hypothetical protein